MALHILQPGLRPIGQFDLDAGNTVTGGEIGLLAPDTDTGTTTEDPAAADVTGVGPYSANSGHKLGVALGQPGAVDTTDDTVPGALRFLLDEGTDGYGTLFGNAIGGTAGQGVTYGTSSGGAVVAMGPNSGFASGKVTCWHAPGLYGVSGAAAANLGSVATNGALYADANGILTSSQTNSSDSVALMVGGLFDDSLVSTTAAAATGSAGTAEKHAIYFLGQK